MASQKLVETLFMCCRLAQLHLISIVYYVYHLCLDNTNIPAFYGITNHRIQAGPKDISVTLKRSVFLAQTSVTNMMLTGSKPGKYCAIDSIELDITP